MRKFYPRFLFSLFMMVCSIAAFSQVSVTATAGTAGPTSYTTLRSAFAAINNGTHQGVVTVSITGNVTETASAVLDSSGAGGASYTAVNISTTGTFTVSMNADTSLINLNGADNVTLDGNNTLTLTNTNTAGNVIEFHHGASNNTIKKAIIKGSTHAVTQGFPDLGVIWFNKGLGNGNDNNIIEDCDIDGSGAAACLIFSTGSFGSPNEQNSGNIIRNNKLHDNISNTVSASIAILLVEGNTNWTIENNSIYHTNAITTAGQLMVRGILLLPDFTSDFHIVKGNFVGGNAPNGTGTMSISASGASAAIGFIGIDVETGGTGNLIENNTVTNVNGSYSFSGGSFSNSGIFGFVGGFNGTSTFNNNTVKNITLANNAGFITFAAMHVNARTAGAAGLVSATFNVTNNTIENITGNSGGTAGDVQFYGIRLETSASAGQTSANINNALFNVTGNTVKGMSANLANDATFVRGISTLNNAAGSAAWLIPQVDISNNLVEDLTSNSILSSYSAGVVTGIHFGGSAGVINNVDVEKINNNVIRNLTATNTGNVATVATGIFTNNGIMEISGNKIYNIRNNAVSTGLDTAAIVGVIVRAAFDSTNVFNNFISLGSGLTNNLVMVGIMNNANTTGPVFVQHNSVVITGSGAAGNTRITTPFLRGSELFGTGVGTPVELRNNLFINTRTGGGKHYGLVNTAATPATAWISSHNNIFSSTAATVALWGNTDISIGTYNTNAADANSKSVAVTFVDVAAGDLHLDGASVTDANLQGTPIAEITNDIDNDSRSATAPVMGADEPNVGCVAPAITTQPAVQNICTGSPLNLSVTATGTGLTYQWRKDNADISGATSATFTVASANATHAGDYQVVITNACGNVTSSTVTVTVNDLPVITAQPTAQAGCNGTDVTFNVTATTTTGTLSYQWKKDGVDINGATGSSFTVAASAANAGNYTVVVSNGTCSATSSAAALTVTAATAITTQPTAVTACQGNATFTVVATGAGLTYQWRKDGANINGATNATLVVPVNSGAAGAYSVVVTGTCGSVTSNNANLTYTFCTSVGNVDEDVTSMVLMPNIVKDRTTLRVTANKTMKVKWNVVDGNGKVVMSFERQVMPGKNDISLYVGQLSNGTYMIQGVTGKGLTEVIRFVKH